MRIAKELTDNGFHIEKETLYSIQAYLPAYSIDVNYSYPVIETSEIARPKGKFEFEDIFAPFADEDVVENLPEAIGSAGGAILNQKNFYNNVQSGYNLGAGIDLTDINKLADMFESLMY